MSDSLSPEDEFWDFALTCYGKPGVGQQMLDWQDRRGANVNLALLCVWAAAHGVRLDTAAFRHAEAAAAGWHAAAVVPLRALRRRLKADWAGLAFDAALTRSAIQAAELQAERAEQALMLAALAPWPAVSSAPTDRRLGEANLVAYLGSDAAAEVARMLAIAV